LNIENPISKTTENIIEDENTLKEKMKFIAMNRFKIVPNREKDFENIWKNRETHLNDVSGFIEFHLVKGNSVQCMHLILPGILVKTLKPGLNQRHFVKHTKVPENIAVFILGTQNLKVLK